MSETVVLYPLTMVIQLVIVCLSCDFGLLILSLLAMVKEFILALSGSCVVSKGSEAAQGTQFIVQHLLTTSQDEAGEGTEAG